ncbi:AbrB/MazE/SpoVT family DNA-binding domain-containing protein [Uliginosibacterium sp. 31-16]|uniref:AbrB/MazE/SpoVT family DNA-binding domain-containing protein n=1 Tax=Uliginosibacterium sp. 31-16 TaxID=3068315 RepID=UPI003532802A
MPKLCVWGNSLGVRLPSHVAEMTGVRAGDELNVRVSDAGIIEITPAKLRKTPTFARASAPRAPRKSSDEW